MAQQAQRGPAPRPCPNTRPPPTRFQIWYILSGTISRLPMKMGIKIAHHFMEGSPSGCSCAVGVRSAWQRGAVRVEAAWRLKQLAPAEGPPVACRVHC